MDVTRTKSTLKIVYDTDGITKDHEILPEIIEGALRAGAQYLVDEGLITGILPALLDSSSISAKFKNQEQDDAENTLHCDLEIDAAFICHGSVGNGEPLNHYVSDELLASAVGDVFKYMISNDMLTEFNHELSVKSCSVKSEVVTNNPQGLAKGMDTGGKLLKLGAKPLNLGVEM